MKLKMHSIHSGRKFGIIETKKYFDLTIPLLKTYLKYLVMAVHKDLVVRIFVAAWFLIF